MIKCPNPDCGFENVDGTQFCEVCGEELPDPTAAATADTSDLIPCPQCGEPNPKDNVACEACGAELHPNATPAPIAPDAATAIPPAALAAVIEDEATPFDALTEAASLPAPAVIAPTAAPASSFQVGQVKLVVEQGQTVGAQFVLGDAELLVGREDEEEDIYPDIDLSDQDAGYVHRKHATLRFENGGLTVTHLGGANKTRVNNKPVPDNVPTPVNLGDKLAFGKVVLRLLPA